MLRVCVNYPLDQLNTFKVKAKASAFVTLDSRDQLDQLSELAQQYESVLVLGGGSNLLFIDDFCGLVIYPQLKGIQVVSEDQEQVILRVAASENWHELVKYTLQQGYYGLENLALIPGTVGAAPVQNIGAYGVEIKQFIEMVECLDLRSGKTATFSNADCQFGYRDSRIKQAGQGQYLVTQVDLRLSKKPQLVLDYQPLKTDFKNASEVTPQQVFDRVCEIRRSKLPDPNKIANAGSFFKNPLISAEHYAQLQTEFPELVAYPQSDGCFKVAAGWLIDQAGFKGLTEGKIGVHKQQALVLVNYSDSSGRHIWQLAQKIMRAVDKKYKVALEPEVRVLPAKILTED
ncbi:MAG: UDP-N-acetylmuramate dehydrogenase [Enterobacterales bacterium]|nr:UDP-N-acetylmuramate dehydrogenase [Enterobacterales bacterium]